MLLFQNVNKTFWILRNNFMKGCKLKALKLSTSKLSKNVSFFELLNGNSREEKNWPEFGKENTSRKNLWMHISI